MNWTESIILILCSLDFILLAIIFVLLRRTREFLFAPRRLTAQAVSTAGGPPKAEDKSVIIMTPERDARILDGEEE